MLKSMTGFGRAEHKDDKLHLQVEVRSVNNKYLKVTSDIPKPLLSYQEQLERHLREKVHRGSIHLGVEYRTAAEAVPYRMNLETLKGYYHSLQELRKELGPEGEVPLAALFSLPGICEKGEGLEKEAEAHLPILESLIDSALERLQEMRTQEGKALQEEILRCKRQIERLLTRLARKSPQVVEDYKERLSKRVSQLLKGTDVELADGDLAREVAFFAERSDITEEISRLKSHLQQMDETIKGGAPAGRRLEFIIQEMFREANTMGSKVGDGEMLRDVIDIKMEIEKIKEQAFNVE
ncbi:MAG: YicC/YloC family endoribonuclease [Candidatus Brocadiales bacterium]